MLSRVTRGPYPFLALLAASSYLGYRAITAILLKAGRPALPLDDSFIHLQYAARLADGAFFSYTAGQGFTTGATAPLWPLLMAPFAALGVEGHDLIWVAWGFGTLAHAGVAYEAGKLASGLGGRLTGIIAALLCLVFGAFAWFAWSGMETVPLAYVLLASARLAAERIEAERPAKGSTVLLVALGLLAPLLRPEGALASLIAATALAAKPEPLGVKQRLWGLAPLAGPLVVPLTNVLLAGHATSSTTMVKWLVANPYYHETALYGAVGAHLQLLWTNIVNGGLYTAVFVPEGARPVIVLGLVATLALGWREKRLFRALAVLAIGCAIVVPTTYLSFLWNRVRYVWPFSAALLVGVACLAALLGDVAGRLARPLKALTALFGAFFIYNLAGKLDWTLADLSQSAYAIDAQQVSLGEWAAEELPEDARIGVNDTGAIAYFSQRQTFDVVGLTTEGEAPYWVSGPGSRFEHYEKMPRESLPTHFIVYPEWMACDAVLGPLLTERVVVNQSILGGVRMAAFEADYSLLGSGEHPYVSHTRERLLDHFDVSDMESEALHRYGPGWGAQETLNVVTVGRAPRDVGDLELGPLIADGGRNGRRFEQFTLSCRKGAPSTLVARLSAEVPTQVGLAVDGVPLTTLSLAGPGWAEYTVELPPCGSDGSFWVGLEALEGGSFGAYGYWLYGD